MQFRIVIGIISFYVICYKINEEKFEKIIAKL